ncbi:MAG: hypothetical protein ACYDBS_09485, partial [Acidimicrobiales bacterium]
MPNAFPDLSSYLDDIGEPSDAVLARAWSMLERTVASDASASSLGSETHTEPLQADIAHFQSHNRSSPRWRRAAVVVAVAAVSIAAIVIPLSVRSGHPAPSHPVPASRRPTARPHIAPLADVAATPKGWSPVALGNAQISVPSSWYIESQGNSTCGGGIARGVTGIVFLGEGALLPSSMGCSRPANVVTLTHAGHRPIPHGRTAIVNGIHVRYGWTRAGPVLTYVERALGMEVTASGPRSRAVLQTITHSPLSVVLGSAVGGTPAGWRTVVFGGLRFAVPSGWQTTRQTWWGGCPFGIAAKVLVL